MNDGRLKLPKLPRFFRQKIVDAIRRVELDALFSKIDRDAFALLDEYRCNRTTGITNPAYVRSIPPSLLSSVERLDKAFRDAHALNGNDLVCEATRSALMKKTRKLSTRTPTYDHEEIKAEAAKLGYWNAPRGRKELVLDQIVKNLRLDQQNQSTTAESWRRNLRRILGSKPASTTADVAKENNERN